MTPYYPIINGKNKQLSAIPFLTGHKECTGLADENGFVIVKNALYDFCKNYASAVMPDSVTEASIPDSVIQMGDFVFK